MCFAARKKAGTANAGLWEFPGGKIQVGESQEKALIREWQEEFGWEIEPLQALAQVKSLTGTGAPLWLMPWRIGSKQIQPKHLTDHDAVAWIEPADVRHLAWGPADEQVLSEVLGWL